MSKRIKIDPDWNKRIETIIRAASTEVESKYRRGTKSKPDFEEFRGEAIPLTRKYAQKQKAFVINQSGPKRGEEFFEYYEQTIEDLRKRYRSDLEKIIRESHNRIKEIA